MLFQLSYVVVTILFCCNALQGTSLCSDVPVSAITVLLDFSKLYHTHQTLTVNCMLRNPVVALIYPFWRSCLSQSTGCHFLKQVGSDGDRQPRVCNTYKPCPLPQVCVMALALWRNITSRNSPATPVRRMGNSPPASTTTLRVQVNLNVTPMLFSSLS